MQKNKAINVLQQLTRTACIPVSAEFLTEGNNVITRRVCVKPIQVVQRLSSLDSNNFPLYIPYLPSCLKRIRETLEIKGEHNVLDLEHVKLVLEMMYSSIKGAIALTNEIYIIALLRNIIYKLADLLHHDANHNDKMREYPNSFILCTFQFKLILINGSLLNHLVLFLLIVADLKTRK